MKVVYYIFLLLFFSGSLFSQDMSKADSNKRTKRIEKMELAGIDRIKLAESPSIDPFFVKESIWADRPVGINTVDGGIVFNYLSSTQYVCFIKYNQESREVTKGPTAVKNFFDESLFASLTPLSLIEIDKENAIFINLSQNLYVRISKSNIQNAKSMYNGFERSFEMSDLSAEFIKANSIIDLYNIFTPDLQLKFKENLILNTQYTQLVISNFKNFYELLNENDRVKFIRTHLFKTINTNDVTTLLNIPEISKIATTIKLEEDLQSRIDNAVEYTVLNVPLKSYSSDNHLRISGKKNLILNLDSCSMIVNTNLTDMVVEINNCENIWIQNGNFKHYKVPENQGGSGCSGVVFSVNGSSNVFFNNCNINGCGTIGISTYDSKNIEIRGCNIHNNSYAAYCLSKTENVLLSNNNLFNNGGEGRNEKLIYNYSYTSEYYNSSPNESNIANPYLGRTSKQKKFIEEQDKIISDLIILNKKMELEIADSLFILAAKDHWIIYLSDGNLYKMNESDFEKQQLTISGNVFSFRCTSSGDIVYTTVANGCMKFFVLNQNNRLLCELKRTDNSSNPNDFTENFQISDDLNFINTRYGLGDEYISFQFQCLWTSNTGKWKICSIYDENCALNINEEWFEKKNEKILTRFACTQDNEGSFFVAKLGVVSELFFRNESGQVIRLSNTEDIIVREQVGVPIINPCFNYSLCLDKLCFSFEESCGDWCNGPSYIVNLDGTSQVQISRYNQLESIEFDWLYSGNLISISNDKSLITHTGKENKLTTLCHNVSHFEILYLKPLD